MLRLINRVLLFIVLLGLALYIPYFNREQGVMRLGPSSSISTTTGFLYLVSFLAGILAASLAALVISAKQYFRERALTSAVKQREQFDNLILKARSAVASGELRKACDLWKQIIKRDADNVIARVELSRTYESLGDDNQALYELDVTRVRLQKNPEVLFRAAELNMRLGNKTAALDNLALIVAEGPNVRAAEMARDLSADLGRVAEALDYHDQVESLKGQSDHLERIKESLLFKRIVKDSATNPDALKSNLTSFIKRHPQSVDALAAMAELEEREGAVESAAEYRVRLAKITGSLDDWYRVIRLWTALPGKDIAARTGRAISAAKAAATQARGANRLYAELALARVMLAFGKTEDAQQVLNGLDNSAKREELAITPQLRREINIVKGAVLHRAGYSQEAAKIFETLALDYDLASTSTQIVAPSGKVEPSPFLSTP